MNATTLRSALFISLSAGLLVGSNARAQEKPKAKTLIITRGDTIINGKNIKMLTQQEKAAALKDFPSLKDDKLNLDRTGIIIGREHAGRGRGLPFGTNENGSIIMSDGDSVMTRNFDLGGNRFRLMDSDSLFREMMSDSLFSRFMARIPGGRSGAEKANSQTFSYSTVGKDGMSTKVSFRVNDPSAEEFGKISGRVKDGRNILEAADLTLFPNFSTGRVTLTFNLASKGSADLRILDADQHALLTEKLQGVNGTFTKILDLPKNGRYYIAVNQNGKWLVKTILKQN